MQEMLDQMHTFCHPILCHDDAESLKNKKWVMDVTLCTTIVQLNVCGDVQEQGAFVSRTSIEVDRPAPD